MTTLSTAGAALRPKKQGRAQFFVAALCLLAFTGAATAATCKEPAPGSDKAPLISPPHGNVVTGAGRLQFYSAPNERCAMEGVFVVPGDELTSYAETDDGWTSVMYFGNKHAEVSGWVRSGRLKDTGTLGPDQ